MYNLLTPDLDSPAGSSDNENDADETMEDADEEANGDVEMDGDIENDEENEEDEDEQDYTMDNRDETPIRTKTVPQHVNTVLEPPFPVRNIQTNGDISHNGSDDTRMRPVLDDRISSAANGAPSTPLPHNNVTIPRYRPAVREDAIGASVYDIVPTIAAPHSTSINSVTSTPDMRWVFSGGADGWIRKFNWVDTANSKSMLTVAQRHPFVDSVTKAGVLMSYWENEETSGEFRPRAFMDES